MEENGFQQLENKFPLATLRSVFKKLFPLISVTVLASRKKLLCRQFSVQIKCFSNSWNEGYVKKYHSIRQEKSLWFVLARKSISTTQNEAFVENTFPLYGKTVSSSGKKIENGFHQQENVFLLKFIPPNFNHGFQQHKKGSEQKHTVSTRQKICFHQPE